MPSLALVSCGKLKVNQRIQAKELYVGDLFKKSRLYVERNHDGWMILSALHHLVAPHQELDPYEYTLIGKNKATIQTWSDTVFAQIKERCSPDTVIYMYAGREYRKCLLPLLESAGYRVETPLIGLGIGEQLSWFKQRISI